MGGSSPKRELGRRSAPESRRDLTREMPRSSSPRAPPRRRSPAGVDTASGRWEAASAPSARRWSRIDKDTDAEAAGRGGRGQGLPPSARTAPQVDRAGHSRAPHPRPRRRSLALGTGAQLEEGALLGALGSRTDGAGRRCARGSAPDRCAGCRAWRGGGPRAQAEAARVTTSSSPATRTQTRSPTSEGPIGAEAQRRVVVDRPIPRRRC